MICQTSLNSAKKKEERNSRVKKDSCDMEETETDLVEI
jgi:hypothetical protein